VIEVRLREWQTISPDTEEGECLSGLELSNESARELAKSLTSSGTLKIHELRNGIEISSRSHVGRLTLGNLCITIEPKIPGPHLLSLFRYAYDLRNLHLYLPTGYKIGDSLFPDLLIAQLLTEVRELLSRGLCRRYEPTDEDLVCPRGRLNILSLARVGGVIKGSLPCRHHPRSQNTLLNQVLAAGLELASRMTETPALKVNALRLAHVVQQEAERTVLTTTLINHARHSINRLVAAYKSAIELIGMLFNSSQVSFEDGSTVVDLPGFLFDMNRFFQALLSRFLSENLEGIEIREEFRLFGMFSLVTARGPGRPRPPTPRPDFAVLKEGKILNLLDAKYRDLWSNSLPREMLYQLALYSISQKTTSEAVILYPTNFDHAIETKIALRDPVWGKTRSHIVMRPVHLGRLAAVVTTSTRKQRIEARPMARWLAVGEM
jgi:5-methylcytosine-specific restriction enzyme subunit McrC